jgi:prepilin signal peptidase PulO-like enzyme (type II secretory pathway)
MIIYFIIFIFGLAVGSFLNAVIFRLEEEESVIWSDAREGVKGAKNNSFTAVIPKIHFTRSHCPHCRRTLKWHDLIPVFSFLFLRGKCRYCGKKISWQYPVVEIATGLIFLLIFWKIWTPKFILEGIGLYPEQVLASIYWLYIASVLIIIFVYDLRHYLIPDKILFPAIAITFLWRSFWALGISHWSFKPTLSVIAPQLTVIDNFWLYFFAAVIASGFFLALVLVSRGKWMGLGDVKLAFLMGLILGWPDILAALFFAFALGAIIGVALIFSSRTKKNYSLKSQIPFAPFLILGTFTTLFWGSSIIEWYEQLFL